MVREATGYPLDNTKLRKLLRRKNRSAPYARLGAAFVEGNGVRLSWIEVEELMNDDAIAAAVYSVQEESGL